MAGLSTFQSGPKVSRWTQNGTELWKTSRFTILDPFGPLWATLECWQACHAWPFLFVLLVRFFGTPCILSQSVIVYSQMITERFPPNQTSWSKSRMTWRHQAIAWQGVTSAQSTGGLKTLSYKCFDNNLWEGLSKGMDQHLRTPISCVPDDGQHKVEVLKLLNIQSLLPSLAFYLPVCLFSCEAPSQA